MTPIRDLHEDRDLRVRALRAGHVRLGQFVNGHPAESPTFVFTSADQARLVPLARDLGGVIDRYTPQGGGEEPWRLITSADAFTALFPFGDLEANVSQDWVLWGRMGLKRRCDGYDVTTIAVDEMTGEVEEEHEPCICAAQEHRECAASTRLRLFIPSTGLVIWELVTHSRIGASELYDQARFIDATTRGQMNHVPIRVVWAPRQIAYFDQKAGRRRTTTKRVVSLAIAGDAESALRIVGMPADQALLAAVQYVLDTSSRRALGEGSAPLGPGAPTEGGAGDGQGETHGEPPTEGDGPPGRAAAEPDGRPSAVGAQTRDEDPDDPAADPASGVDEPSNAESDERAAPGATSRPSPRDCAHPRWRVSNTRPGLEICVECGAGRKRVSA